MGVRAEASIPSEQNMTSKRITLISLDKESTVSAVCSSDLIADIANRFLCTIRLKIVVCSTRSRGMNAFFASHIALISDI